MEYELVYDAARDFTGWQIVAGSIVVFVFLIVTIYFDQFIPRIVHWLVFHGDHVSDWRRAMLGVVVLLCGAISAGIITENLKLRSLSKKDECTQIEGVVSDFEPTADRRLRESFTLKKIEFEYASGVLDFGFNKAAANGGPIYEGAEVRLCYVDWIGNRKNERKIIRVETALKSI